MRYAVVLEKAARNYSAYVPDLPGCIVTGKTVAQVMARMKEAIEVHLHGMAEDNETVPDPTTLVDYVDVRLPSLEDAA